MKYSHRFFLYAPLGVFLLLLAGVGAHWWIEASALAGWLDARNGREIVPGVTMRFAERRTTGFPFSLDTEFRDLSLTLASPRGPRTWHSEKFAMHALSYGRDETIFEAAGHQSLSWPAHTMAFAVGSLHASAIRAHGALARFDLDIMGFGSPAFTAQRLQLHARTSAHEGLEYLIEAAGLSISSEKANGDADVRASGVMTSAGLLVPLLSGQSRWFEVLERWRNGGGALRVDDASVASCGIRQKSEHGALRIDDRHSLRGMLKFDSAGLPQAPGNPKPSGCPAAPDDGILGGTVAGIETALLY